jgi:hypothetical protein
MRIAGIQLTKRRLPENSASNLSRIKNTLVAVVLVLSIGLHWPLLQSVAWLNMIVCFAKEQGFQQAVATTFSGKHPCKLCKFVTAGQKAEKKQTKEVTSKKFDLFAVTTAPFIFSTPVFHRFAEPLQCLETRACAPLAPPPDLA